MPVAFSDVRVDDDRRAEVLLPGPSSEASSSYTGFSSRVANGVAHTTISSPPFAAPMRGQLAA